jgi:hypothetical protein
LAALGLARLPEIVPRAVWAWGLALAGGGVGLAAVAWWGIAGRQAHANALFLGLGIAATFVLATTAVAVQRGWRAAPQLLLALVCADLVGHGAWVEVEVNDPTRGFQFPAVVAFVRALPGPLRIDNTSGAWSPDAAARLGLEDISGISNPLALATYETYLGAVGARGSPLYNFLNAQFVLADKGQPPGDSALVPVFADDPALDVYLNTKAQPRVRLAQAAQVVAGGEAAFGAIHAPGFDPERMVVIDSTSAAVAPPPLTSVTDPAGERNLFYTAYAPEAQTVVTRSPTPAYLVYSEVWYPGWRAWLDGVEAPIYRANFAFRAVYLPTGGEHTVEMRFDPATWKLGLAITLLTVAALAAWRLATARRQRVE